MAKRTPYQQADKIQDQADRIYMLEEDARRCVERYVKAEAENADLRAQVEQLRDALKPLTKHRQYLVKLDDGSTPYVEVPSDTVFHYIVTKAELDAAKEASE